MKVKLLSCVGAIACVLLMLGAAQASRIDVDMTNSTGTPVSSSPIQIRIDDLTASWTDPASGQFVELDLDVIFQWDPEKFVLVPVALADAELGQLRVQVSCSVTGHPLVGSIVTIGDKAVMTDEDGIARFYGLSAMPMTVRVEAEGYVSEGILVEVPAASWKRMAVGLMPEAAD